MQIKAIKNSDSSSNRLSEQWILETSEYELTIVRFESEDEVHKLAVALHDFYDPFGIWREGEEFVPFSVVVIRNMEKNEHIVLTDCGVFITNRYGKTVDRYVAGNI